MYKIAQEDIGQTFVRQKLISQGQLEKALRRREEEYDLLGNILVKMGFVTEDEVLSCLALRQGVEQVDLSKKRAINSQVVSIIPERLARRFCLIAIAQEDKTLTVAMADPTDIVAIDTIKSNTGYEIHPVLSLKRDILSTIDKYYGRVVDIGRSIKDVISIDAEEVGTARVDAEQLKTEADAPPIVRFVNLLLLQAVEERASDLHIEPTEKEISVRLRIDGALRRITPPPRRMHAAIVSRIKIMSNLDIAERRLPQDGKCKIKIGSRAVDIRVSSLPTIYGEKIVMRLLDRSNLLLDPGDLGFDPEDLIKFKDALRRPYGMILLTGPTGSGKSTTLYAGLNHINLPEKNIVTVEDPVEYELEGINQIQVKPRIGLTFAQGLRHILRQDPDIIMIGEIRDLETAEIAIHSALTGHLVLSTLHTNDAVSAINRLAYMGVGPYLIAAALNLVIAQRLVRRICLDCKEPYIPMKKALDSFNLDTKGQDLRFYRGKGCVQCGGTGYFGRVALYEVFTLTDRIKKSVLDGVDGGTLKEIARKEGMRTLRKSGLQKVLGGVSTFEEVLGVTSVDGQMKG